MVYYLLFFISCSISSLTYSDIDNSLFADRLCKYVAILSFSLTFRLLGFGSDVVLMWLLSFLIVGRFEILEVIFRA